jgi:putative transposase
VKHRLRIDYRALNAVTKPDAYPIPNTVDTLDSLGCSKIFTVLDMASGYHQVEVERRQPSRVTKVITSL